MEIKLTRDEIKLLAAGQAASTNGYQVDKNRLVTFVEGAMWAFDFVNKKREKYHDDSNDGSRLQKS